MKSNWLYSTIIYVLVVALTCLLFFGLAETSKTDMELVAFGFLIGAETVIYISILISGFIKKKNTDVIATGCAYAVFAYLVNYVFNITTMKTLIIYNIVAIILYLLLVTIVLVPRKK